MNHLNDESGLQVGATVVASPPPDVPAGGTSAVGHPAAPLVVRVGDHAQVFLPSDLAELGLAGQIQAAAEQAGLPALFDIDDLLGWPDDDRWPLLALVARLGPLGRIRLPGSGPDGSEDPFETVLSAMVGPGDLRRCERGRRAAIEAATLYHPDALEGASSRIAGRLRELGVKGILPQAILKQARRLAGGDQDQDRRDATALARGFLDQLKPEGGPADGPPVLRHFRGENFLRVGPRWNRLPDGEMKSQVVRFLQDSGLVAAVTDRLVRDVLTNLEGLALLDCWGELMPFLVVRERPAAVERPRLVAFRNGQVDLDEALDSGQLPGDPPPRSPPLQRGGAAL